jgi:chaperone required for assembly of F1-ATPase
VKRFWKDVSVDANRILLDGRPVRTPLRAELILPTTLLAEAIADEWRACGKDVDPRAMPLTGLANAAIDRAPTPETLSVYAESDLLCYRAEAPDDLIVRQGEVWDPLLDWAQRRYDVTFAITTGIVHIPQPAETLKRLHVAVVALDAFTRTALQPMITIGGSLIVALALLEDAIAPPAAFAATHLDELWQAEKWGDDTWAIQARTHHEQDFNSAARFLALLRPFSSTSV